MANLIIPASSGHYTDDKYSSLLEPNLWTSNPFIPGVTYTDKYQMGAAGQYFVHKVGVGTVTPTAPGADFSDTIVQDSLVTIILDKQFNRSRKMYGVTAAMVEYNAAAAELETAIQEVKQAWILQGVKSLIGTTSIIVSDNDTTVLAAGTVYDQIVDDMTKLSLTDVTPDTLLVSPKVYGYLLKSDEFQRTGMQGDSAIANAIVGRVAGMNVVQYSKLDAAAIDGATIGGITWATGDELEYVMYDSDAYSIVTALEAIRPVDEPTRFVGSLAQVQIVSGYKLTNPARALLKLHDLSAT